MTEKIQVSAPARLHLGFLDLNGESGRKFGSIGLAINSHRITLTAQLSTETSIVGTNLSSNFIERVQALITQFYKSLGKHISPEQHNASLEFTSLIPAHAGFGSGTQLALALGTALCQLHNIPASTKDIAKQLSRGSRSGIGIASFDHGGFILDGGLGAESTIPPLLMHSRFPQAWRIVLIMENNYQGVHGKQELHAFKTLPTFSLQDSQSICHHVLMQLLPAMAEEKIEPFGRAITKIQSLIGDHFAPTQGGRYTSPRIASLLLHAQHLGHSGIAQSSWGPTGCIFVESDEVATQLITELSSYATQKNLDTPELSFIIAKANESGADIVV